MLRPRFQPGQLLFVNLRHIPVVVHATKVINFFQTSKCLEEKSSYAIEFCGVIRKKTGSRFSLSAVSLIHSSLFTFHFSLFTFHSKRAVAHAARGAQCRDDGGDDAADDLEDGLPRFFVVLHGIRCFLGVELH